MDIESGRIRFRLSGRQVSLIWDGLNKVVTSDFTWRKQKRGTYSYPLDVYPPPPGFDRGTRSKELMALVVGLWQSLRPKISKGGRVQMNAFEIRIAIFALRANIGWHRHWKHKLRASDAETKQRWKIDPESLKRLRSRTRRVIHSLERYLKRANRRMLLSIDKADFSALLGVWRAHLRWMRVHIAYFPAPRPLMKGRKAMSQRILDEMVAIAERGLRDKGYQAPDPEDLRKLMRLYAAYSRRGRIGSFSVPVLMQFKKSLSCAWQLAAFVLQRRKLPLIGQPPLRRAVRP
jgi:hypothetical protein